LIDWETSSLRLRGFTVDIGADLDERFLVDRGVISFLDGRKGLWSCWITLSTPLDADSFAVFWVINLSSCFRTVTSDSDRLVTDTGDIDELDGGGILFFTSFFCRG